MSSEMQFDNLSPKAREALLEKLYLERYGPVEMLEMERLGLRRKPATTRPAQTMEPATSSSSEETKPLSVRSIGARRVETSTLLKSWEGQVFESLDELNEAYMKDAEFRVLRRHNNQFVPGDGPTEKPRLMLIGEAPGAKEQSMGRPFVGVSGNMLTSMLWELRVHRRDCYVTNVVKYRPPNNRKPLPEEMDASAPYLRDEIKLVYPNGGLIILLGATALEIVDEKRRVLRDHAQPFRHGRWKFVPMAHPSYVLQGRMPRDTYVAAWASLLPHLTMPIPDHGFSSPSVQTIATGGRL